MANKVTKKDLYTMILNTLTGEDSEVVAEDVTLGDIREFVNKQIESIDAKAAKAKEKAAEKKAEGDELRESVRSVLTNDYVGAEAITEKVNAVIEGEPVTKAKVIARLTQLVNAGLAVKQEMKGEGKKYMAYAIATEVEGE